MTRPFIVVLPGGVTNTIAHALNGTDVTDLLVTAIGGLLGQTRQRAQLGERP